MADGALSIRAAQSALGVAMNYALERRANLERFLEDPRISMDNNQSERDLRHVAVGRNYAEFVIMLSIWWRPPFHCSPALW